MCSERVHALCAGGTSGRCHLTVASVDGASAIVRCAATAPLHLFTPRARGPAVAAIVATYGGGLVAGDEIDLTVEVDRGAIAALTTQAETKVYRSDGRWASQRMAARVGEDAALAIVPEPTACFAGARYRQHQRFDLDRRASLLLVDAVTPGRSARGERWSFEACLSRNDVHCGGTPVLRDAIRLVAGEGPPVERRMAGFELLATVVAIGPAAAVVASSLLEIGGGRATAGADVLVAASPLLDGAYVRIAARTVEAGLALVRGSLALAGNRFGRDALDRRP